MSRQKIKRNCKDFKNQKVKRSSHFTHAGTKNVVVKTQQNHCILIFSRKNKCGNHIWIFTAKKF